MRYTRRAVMEDAAFVAAQIEGLRKSGGLVPGELLARPACVDDLRTILAKTRKEEAVAERRARSNAARAARSRAARTGERQARAAGVPINTNKPLSQIEKARLAMADLPPREPRTAPPPPAEGVVPDAYGAPHALINETLTLWDLTQTHGGYLKLPPCPWWRFARAFLEPRPDGTGATSETTDGDASFAGVRPSDAALVRDVCVALVRVAEVRSRRLWRAETRRPRDVQVRLQARGTRRFANAGLGREGRRHAQRVLAGNRRRVG